MTKPEMFGKYLSLLPHEPLPGRCGWDYKKASSREGSRDRDVEQQTPIRGAHVEYVPQGTLANKEQIISVRLNSEDSNYA
jgi:hypothetical protein